MTTSDSAPDQNGQPKNPVSKAADDVQQAVSRARKDIQQTAAQVGEEARRVVNNVEQSVGQTVEQTRETIAQVGTDATRSVSEARKAMRESAYTVKESAADSLLSAAENIRREALKSGNDDIVRNAHTLSRSMEKAALYLDSHTFDQISDDATEVVRENVWQSMGVVFILGLLIGLLMGGDRD